MYLRLHSAGKDCPRAVQRGDHGSGTKPVCLHICTGGTVLILRNVPQREGGELLSAGRTGRSVSLCSWLLLSNCRASGAWHRHCRPWSPDPRPWWGAGSCHTSPWQGEPLLQPCSISHCFCGGQKADLGWEKTTSANKLLWPVPSICSLTFCRFWNSRC